MPLNINQMRYFVFFSLSRFSPPFSMDFLRAVDLKICTKSSLPGSLGFGSVRYGWVGVWVWVCCVVGPGIPLSLVAWSRLRSRSSRNVLYLARAYLNNFVAR